MKSQVEQVARLAMKLEARHLADYGSVKSRHDFTQRQLMSCLILKTYLKATYRSIIDLLEGHAGLRRELGLEDKLPHYTALQKFSARKDVSGVCASMIAHIGQAALKAAAKKSGGQQATELAVDESFFGGMKRVCGAALSARKEVYLHQQTALRVLAYDIHR